MRKLIPVILCGGSGSRLWPLSRDNKPKPFLRLGGDHSLFQATLLRCAREGWDDQPIIVAAAQHLDLVERELAEIGVAADILLEPVARNSAAAIAFAAMHAAQTRPGSLLMAMACDHIIGDHDAFSQTAFAGMEVASAGYLVAFGISPRHASTSFGYIERGNPIPGAALIKRFVEKPDAAHAQVLMDDGALWNSGNFLFSAEALLGELAAHQPEITAAVQEAYELGKPVSNAFLAERSAFELAPSISFDHALMEKTRKAAVIAADYFWSDIGTWNMDQRATAGFAECDGANNQLLGDVMMLDSENNLVHSQGRMAALVGAKDLIVVNTDDALLIADRDSADKVRHLVDVLRLQNRLEVQDAPGRAKPWGRYDRLDKGERYQVKRICVATGGALSLQRHRHRAEHWIIIEGRGEVTINDKRRNIAANDAIYIPQGAKHRLRNTGNRSLVLIEVQTGTYFGEDDIQRFDDEYGRV